MAVYYIDPSGTDSAGVNGSISNPWKTLRYACTRVTSSGDIIHVNGGSYTETSQSSLAVNVSIEGEINGTSIINTTYINTSSSSGGFILLNGGANTNQSISYLTINGNRTGWRAISVYNRSNVHVHHCNFIDMDFACVTFFVSGLNNSFHHNTAVNSSGGIDEGTYGTRGEIVKYGNQTGLQIYNNVLTQEFREDPNGRDIGVCINSVYSQPSTGDHTIYEWMYSNDCKIFNNIITWPLQGSGWYFAFEIWLQRGLEIYGNTIQGQVDICHSYPQNIYPIGSTVKYNAYVHDNTFQFPTLNPYVAYGIQFEAMNTQIILANNLFKNLSIGIFFCNYKNFWEVFDINEKVEDIWIYGNVFQNIGFTDYSYDWTFGVLFENGSSNPSDPTAHPVYSFDNVNIWNNTFTSYVTRRSHAAISLPCQATNTPVSNISIRNNIMIGFDYGINSSNSSIDPDWAGTKQITNLTIQDNITHGCTDDSDFTGITLINSNIDAGIISDPLFLNETEFDYHLYTESSPAYRSGTYVELPLVNTDMDGNLWTNPPDIGAYAYINLSYGVHFINTNLNKVTPFPTVTIGTQVWMARNWDWKTGSYPNGDEDNVNDYGVLYTWQQAKDIADSVSGWRLPTVQDFATLFDYLGGPSVAGGHLKETGTIYWDSPNTGADNSSGFSARGASNGGTVRYTNYLWGEEVDSTTAIVLTISCNSAAINIGADIKTETYSIRLIKE